MMGLGADRPEGWDATDDWMRDVAIPTWVEPEHRTCEDVCANDYYSRRLKTLYDAFPDLNSAKATQLARMGYTGEDHAREMQTFVDETKEAIVGQCMKRHCRGDFPWLAVGIGAGVLAVGAGGYFAWRYFAN